MDGLRVQWKRFDGESGRRRSSFGPAFQVAVGPVDLHSSRSLSISYDALLRILQSPDDTIVVAVMAERLLSQQESSQELHFSVACSPIKHNMRANGQELRFSVSVSGCRPEAVPIVLASSLIQELVYPLVIFTGTSVLVLLLSTGISENTCKLCRSVQETECYYTSEFPVEFACGRVYPCPSSKQLQVQCPLQRMFDIERFLQRFLQRYTVLRSYKLVDYDARMVLVLEHERTIFMSCVMQLDKAEMGDECPKPSLRKGVVMAIFFSFHIITGVHVIIQALRVSPTQPLRVLATKLQQKYRKDLRRRVGVGVSAQELNNAAVLKGESKTELHNPRYPISIYMESSR